MKDSIIRIAITLLDVDPAIWRRIEVPASMTLEGLHDVVQILMGWADYHLHHFQFGDVMYGVPAPDDREMNDGRKVKLWTVLDDGERVFLYLYDYGDGWCCVVVLEAVAPAIPGVAYPRLVDGARRGPPEDVGGPWDYSEFLEATADPKHERHKELLEWCDGDFDPQQFDIDTINRRLASLAPRKSPRRKTAKQGAG
jgi:Plasmid pRiA4b ORF-3-like protein